MDEVLTKIICFQDWYFWWPNKFSTFSISLILKPSWWSLKSLPCPSDEEGLRRQLYLQECWWFAYEAWLLWRLCTISSSLKTGFLERALDSFEGTWGTTLCLDFLIKMKTILSYGFASFMICSILAPSRMVICCFPISHVDCDFLLWSGHNGYRSGKEGLLK